MTEHHPEHAAAAPTNAWRRFWERGGFWRALVFTAVYFAIYFWGFGWLVGTIFPESVRGEKGGALDIFITVGLPLLLGCILLVILAVSFGWLKELFAKQPIRGRGWMWIAVALVLVLNIATALNTDWAGAGLALSLSYFAVGLLVGFAEEVLTRGFVVNLMRKAGHPEIAVAIASAGLFAAMHSANAFTGQSLMLTIQQVGYTFFFGICMYLALRVTGNLIWPILLHASTDPTGFLWNLHPGAQSPITLVAAFNNWIYVVVGIVLLIVLIFNGGKDRVYTKEGLKPADPALT